MFTNNNQFGVSRIFNITDAQYKGLYLKERNNIQPLYQNTNEEVILIDDDSVTNSTFDYVEKKYKLTNTKRKTLIDHQQINYYDIVDLRDFIIGLEDSGLKVNFNKNFIRIPYFYPFVNLRNRASIDINLQSLFTLDIIDINMKIYKNKKIKDLKNQDLFLISGFQQEDYINDFLIFLKNLIKN